MTSIVHRIAERAGVSPSTVTRILNGEVSYRRPFYAERARRIRAIAEELNYRPNIAARAVSTGRFDALCLVASSTGRGGLPPHLVDGLVEGATSRGRLLTQARLPDVGFTDPRKLPTILRSAVADGLLVNYTHGWPPGLHDAIAAAGVPAVWLNVRAEQDCLHFADREAAHDATRRLVELGHRRIALITVGGDPRTPDPGQHYSLGDRWTGYREAMTAAGLQPRVVVLQPGWNGDLAALPAIAECFTGPERPTAVLATDLGPAVAYAATRHGLRLPEDLSLIHFARFRFDGLKFPIANLAIPQRELGLQAIDYLLDRIAEPEHPSAPKTIPIPLTCGNFLAPPPQAAQREP